MKTISTGGAWIPPTGLQQQADQLVSPAQYSILQRSYVQLCERTTVACSVRRRGGRDLPGGRTRTKIISSEYSESGPGPMRHGFWGTAGGRLGTTPPFF